MDGETDLALASEFPPASYEDWLALAGDLDALRATTYDGITIEPLYTSADAVPEREPSARGLRQGWDVRQLVDPAQGDRLAVAELERGATSLWLRLRDQPRIDEALLDAVLDGVLLDLAPVVLDAGPRWLQAATALAHLGAHRKIDAANFAGGFGADPYGELFTQRQQGVLEGDLDALVSEARILSVEHPYVRVATVDGTRFHDVGASDAQELGYALAATVATLRTLTGGGLDLTAAFSQMELRLAATVDQFATIAKFRAARLLLVRTAEVSGDRQAAAKTPLHAVTSRVMATRYDSAVNMLRSTVACFAAGIGGADAVTVLPHDALTTPSELGRRIARNTQSILAMESNAARVADPAGGSWFVERLTDQLAEAAWSVFQEVETAGGFVAAVETGIVDERIAATRRRRDDDIDHRRFPITGVSEFPDVSEMLPPSRVWAVPRTDGNDPAVHRYAERFEQLRQRVDATAPRPAIFLATVGSPAAFTSAMTSATNYFGAAGITPVRGPVTSDAAEIAAAFAATDCTVACICGQDGDGAVEEALTATDASRVYRATELPANAHAGLADLLEHLAVRR